MKCHILDLFKIKVDLNEVEKATSILLEQNIEKSKSSAVNS